MYAIQFGSEFLPPSSDPKLEKHGISPPNPNSSFAIPCDPPDSGYFLPIIPSSLMAFLSFPLYLSSIPEIPDLLFPCPLEPRANISFYSLDKILFFPLPPLEQSYIPLLPNVIDSSSNQKPRMTPPTVELFGCEAKCATHSAQRAGVLSIFSRCLISFHMLLG
ncbi:hypothetical protein E3N88_09821 [Mikania micrantha]|uniref:Uncharacterized protein n=1 Tax=Mikania micrantha TaxID=192012 RepID=A0A5N6PN84_9ASTR|nr:hypothetical protein E3N88_09821 [Mikania micrantha]